MKICELLLSSYSFMKKYTLIHLDVDIMPIALTALIKHQIEVWEQEWESNQSYFRYILEDLEMMRFWVCVEMSSWSGFKVDVYECEADFGVLLTKM